MHIFQLLFSIIRLLFNWLKTLFVLLVERKKNINGELVKKSKRFEAIKSKLMSEN